MSPPPQAEACHQDFLDGRGHTEQYRADCTQSQDIGTS